MLTSLYVEGGTYLHKLGVRVKLALLLVFSLSLYFVPWVLALSGAAVVTGLIYFTLPMTLREALYRIRPVLITIAVLAVFNAYVLGPEEALISTLRLLAVLFLAAAITATTTIDAFMETVTALLMPLERLGLLKASDAALTLGLVLRFVPEIFNHYEALKEAHAARGIPAKSYRLIGPLIIMALKDADTIAAAIDARGIRGQ